MGHGDARGFGRSSGGKWRSDCFTFRRLIPIAIPINREHLKPPEREILVHTADAISVNLLAFKEAEDKMMTVRHEWNGV
jgi:hypothetical protein